MKKEWVIEFGAEFEPEFDELPEEVQDELLVVAKLLKRFGPMLSRPHVDTLNESRFCNMKELRFNAANGVWRVAFAFDPARKGILLMAGDKQGVSKKRFYKQLIEKADKRYEMHLKKLSEK